MFLMWNRHCPTNMQREFTSQYIYLTLLDNGTLEFGYRECYQLLCNWAIFLNWVRIVRHVSLILSCICCGFGAPVITHLGGIYVGRPLLYPFVSREQKYITEWNWKECSRFRDPIANSNGTEWNSCVAMWIHNFCMVFWFFFICMCVRTCVCWQFAWWMCSARWQSFCNVNWFGTKLWTE